MQDLTIYIRLNKSIIKKFDRLNESNSKEIKKALLHTSKFTRLQDERSWIQVLDTIYGCTSAYQGACKAQENDKQFCLLKANIEGKDPQNESHIFVSVETVFPRRDPIHDFFNEFVGTSMKNILEYLEAQSL